MTQVSKISDLPPMLPPYKDSANRWVADQLFLERFRPAVHKFRPPFSLYEEKPGYICGLKTFVAMNDPTGYQWAIKYLGSYQHLEKLLTSKWFQEAFAIWVRDLHAKMRGEALANIADVAANAESPTQRLQAAKYLAERPYEVVDNKRSGAKRGRPSASELKGHLKELANISEQTQEEFARIGLKVVK